MEIKMDTKVDTKMETNIQAKMHAALMQIYESVLIAKGFPEKSIVNPSSVHEKDGGIYFIANICGCKYFIAVGGEYTCFEGKDIEAIGQKGRLCDLSAANAKELMRLFPFTAPVNHRGQPTTIGLGDRLGLASAGHIRAIRDRNIFPVLAQQSIRELNLTGRTYPDVLAAAAFASFEEDYREGYGADGDHLKTADEIKYALESGFTMITLDCSEKIDNSITALSPAELCERYDALDSGLKEYYSKKYLNKIFDADGLEISIPGEELKAIVLTYHKAIEYTIELYRDIIKPRSRQVDFEMSIDETLSHTSPRAHFLVAAELLDGGVEITSLAPRFIGEFQKGIDYIGDPQLFEEDFLSHERIAKSLGYKLSVHSGSDKFSVFPAIGRQTGMNVHLKTAGTNWLEAVRVIAQNEHALYRRMHEFALSNVDKARAYYHINGKPENIPPLASQTDGQLPGYLDRDDSRQVIHITYGLLLNEKNSDGSYMFRDDIYAALLKHEAEYFKALEKHIGKHIDKLCGK